jgi:U32 family peptidase
MKLLVDIYSVEHAYQMIDLGSDIIVNIKQLSITKEFNATLAEVQTIQKYAQKNKANVFIMLDRLYHETDLTTLQNTLAVLNKIGITTIIAADLAIINIVKHAGYPIKVINGNTTLNTNYSTMMSPLNAFDGFVLSNEINIKEIYTILEQLDKMSVLQGYGKQRIFYSKRQLLTSYYAFNQSKPLNFKISDSLLISDYHTDANQSYIYEDTNGTYIYTYFDVCALRYHENLMAKGLDYLYLNNIYQDKATYNQIVMLYHQLLAEKLSSKEVLKQLRAINAELSESFLNDKTVFTIADAKLLEKEDLS